MPGMFMQADGQGAGLSVRAATWQLFGSMLFMGRAPGAAVALICGWLPSSTTYLGVALGLATLVSVAVVVNCTPMMGPKTVLHYVVALTFGFLLPRLAAA